MRHCGYPLMSLGLFAGVHRVMAAHSTHQAFKGSGKTAQMTAGFPSPITRRQISPAPIQAAARIGASHPSYSNLKRQSRD